MHVQAVRAITCNRWGRESKEELRKSTYHVPRIIYSNLLFDNVLYTYFSCIMCSVKYPAASGPPVDRVCEQCGSTFKVCVHSMTFPKLLLWAVVLMYVHVL